MSASHATSVTTHTSESGAPKPQRPFARLAALALCTLALAAGFHHGLDYLVQVFSHESTDDAFLESHVVPVSSRIAGQVRAVRVEDNQWVKQGDTLAELDPRDFEVRQTQKRAASSSAGASLESAKAGLDLMRARLATAEAVSAQEKANAESSRAKAERAKADLQRTEVLRRDGVVSPGEFDRAKADADSTAADLKSDEQKAVAAASQVAEAKSQVGLALTMVASAQTRIDAARADEQAADLDLSYTKIAAPCDGRVTRKSVQAGAFVQVGQPLLALVASNFWVVANFKERELTHMQPGQKVEIHIDTYPGKTFAGRVESIQSGSGARFSLLPPRTRWAIM